MAILQFKAFVLMVNFITIQTRIGFLLPYNRNGRKYNPKTILMQKRTVFFIMLKRYLPSIDKIPNLKNEILRFLTRWDRGTVNILNKEHTMIFWVIFL